MTDIVSINNLSKVYKGGHQALTEVSLTIREGEIFALLGPNGAGKTTLISSICGIVSPSNGSIRVGGHDVVNAFIIFIHPQGQIAFVTVRFYNFTYCYVICH